MIAIYARQSVDKKDSVSIETQIDICKKELEPSEEYQVYFDKGFTGANTNRPQFQKMMKDVQNGIIHKIIVYKLDRISRSLLDFSNIIDVLEKNHAGFISVNEKFDTSNPIGKAMLYIIMVFAQLERETIQQRTKENYYFRGKQGLFLGGHAPIGFITVPTTINGIKTKKLAPDPKAVPLICFIYETYAQDGMSISKILQELNQNKSELYPRENLKRSIYINRILRNPVYVRANADVYQYLKNKGAIMENDISEYDGKYGCTVYGSRENRTGEKFTNLTGDHVQLNQHEGLIAPDLWLKVQYKMDKNKTKKYSGKGFKTWLSGLVKCGYCGMALIVVTNNTKPNSKRYVNCGGHKRKFCNERKVGATFEEIENAVELQLLEHMKQQKFIQTEHQAKNQTEINLIKIELQKIETQIANIINKTLVSNDIMISYLNQEIEKLDTQRKNLLNKISILSVEDSQEITDEQLIDYISHWHTMTIEEKKHIASYFINVIYVKNDDISIQWKNINKTY